MLWVCLERCKVLCHCPRWHINCLCACPCQAATVLRLTKDLFPPNTRIFLRKEQRMHCSCWSCFYSSGFSVYKWYKLGEFFCRYMLQRCDSRHLQEKSDQAKPQLEDEGYFSFTLSFAYTCTFPVRSVLKQPQEFPCEALSLSMLHLLTHLIMCNYRLGYCLVMMWN